jgi:hypothetical protein
LPSTQNPVSVKLIQNNHGMLLVYANSLGGIVMAFLFIWFFSK